MAKLILTFDTKNGEMRVNAEGFQGQKCGQAIEFLKGMGEVTDFQHKAEWYEANLQMGNNLNSHFCG